MAWDLGAGESAVLTWARRNPGFTAILDDRAARRCAESGSELRGLRDSARKIFAASTSAPRQFLVDQAAEFAGFGELLRLVRGFVEQGDGLAEGGGAFLAAGGVVRRRQRRGVMSTRENPTHAKVMVSLCKGGLPQIQKDRRWSDAGVRICGLSESVGGPAVSFCSAAGSSCWGVC